MDGERKGENNNVRFERVYLCHVVQVHPLVRFNTFVLNDR